MSDFRLERLKAIGIRNALNRQRSLTMENRVAKVLGGKRVPFSGAGSIKGDILVHGKHGGGVIECKMSAAYDEKLNDPYIIVAFHALAKIKREAELMKSLGIRFAALVFHFHNIRGDGVLLDAESCNIICPEFAERFPSGNNVVLTLRKTTIKIYSRYFNNWMVAVPVVYADTPIGQYAIMRLEFFRELLDHGCEEEL